MILIVSVPLSLYGLLGCLTSAGENCSGYGIGRQAAVREAPKRPSPFQMSLPIASTKAVVIVQELTERRQWEWFLSPELQLAFFES
jgi:hypothetical protein